MYIYIHIVLLKLYARISEAVKLYWMDSHHRSFVLEMFIHLAGSLPQKLFLYCSVTHTRRYSIMY